ncbi:MAG: inositol monophosphatase [Terricaulis sp.]
MAEAELKELLSIATRVANHAGAALKANRDAWKGVESEQGREVKVDADKRAEALILDGLSRLAPFPVLSEEAGWVDGTAGALMWAVDPLDGSVNYIQGYPHCAVSIALLRGREPVLGVVDCFLLDENFTGLVGDGAWLNGAAMRVSEVEDPARGILNTGVPARARTDPDAMAQLSRRITEWRKVRMLGSAAAALANVAAGRAEAYRESGSMIWDVAGGCALVKAAGGIVRIEGQKIDEPLEVTAGNGRAPLPE